MAHLLCRVGVSTKLLATRFVVPPVAVAFVPIRGKKQARKQKKTKKEIRKEMMKDMMKRRELEKITQEAALKVAKKGEPMDPEMLNPIKKRRLPSISKLERENRYLLVKEWSRFCMERHKQELQLLHGLVRSREKALRELKKVSLPLYSQAMALNPKLFPFDRQGPTTTPPLPGYVPPDLDDS